MHTSICRATLHKLINLQYPSTNIIFHQMDNCTLACVEIYGHLDLQSMCTYAKLNCIQDTVQFVQGYYCLLHSSFILFAIIGVSLFYMLFKTMDMLAESYLTPCVQQFITSFRMSSTLAGVTFLAFANGAPDVLTAIVAGSSDSDSTALIPFGSIFGACLFSTAFILSSLISCIPSQSLKVDKRQIMLPLAFYIVSIFYIIIVSAAYKKMNIYLAIVPLIFYGIYIIITVKSQRKQRRTSQLLDDLEQSSNSNSEDVSVYSSEKESKQQNADGEEGFSAKFQKCQERLFEFLIPPTTAANWKPVQAVVSIIVSPFVLAITQQVPDIFHAKVGGFPVFILVCIPAILLLAYAIYSIIKKQEPQLFIVYTLYSFLITIAWLTVICSVLINLVELVQFLTGINSVFLGLTVFAWANSIGDYLSITKLAKKGNKKTAVAGVFSGQLFNFLLGFGVSLVIQSTGGEYDYIIFNFTGSTYEIISDSIVILVIVACLIFLIFVFVSTYALRGVVSSKQALISRTYYIVFLLLALLISIASDFFYEIICDL